MSFCHTNIYMVITHPDLAFWGGQNRGGILVSNLHQKKHQLQEHFFSIKKTIKKGGGVNLDPLRGGVWEFSVFTSSAMRHFLLETSELRGGPCSVVETLLLWGNGVLQQEVKKAMQKGSRNAQHFVKHRSERRTSALLR